MNLEEIELLFIHPTNFYRYKIRHRLYRTDFPPPEMWIVTLYHFGRDGRTYDGERFRIRFNDFVGGIAYFYIKDWPDGKRRPRLDQICTPNSPLKEIIEQKFRSQEKNLENAIYSLQKEEENKIILEAFRKDSILVEKTMQSMS